MAYYSNIAHKTRNVLACWDLAKGSLEFGQGEIDSVVFDILASTVNRLQQYVDLAKVAT